MKTKALAAVFAILAAALYAINVPLSKLLLEHVGTTMMAAFLYLGAGLGLLVYSVAGKAIGKITIKEPLTRKELPYTVAMVVLDIAAPILLMLGIARTNSANVSLLNNFEIVATSLIAFFIFKEVLTRRLCAAILLVTLASIILGFEGAGSFVLNTGSLFVLGACVCWGFENNCTRMLSEKSPIEVVIIKGFCSGMGSFVIALIMREPIPKLIYILGALLLGFVAYGLSIFFYIYAQRYLGAAKTSAYYAISPFIGVAVSFVIFRQTPTIWFLIALVIMMIGTYFASTDGEM